MNKKEITGVSTADFKDATRMSTSLLREKAYQFTNAKTYFFSDSVLCMATMGDDPIATWKSKIKWYSENNHFKGTNRIDGMPTEFEWKIFPRNHCVGPLREDSKSNDRLQCEQENFKGRMARKKETKKHVNTIHRQLRIMLANSLVGHWSFLGLGSARKAVRNLH